MNFHDANHRATMAINIPPHGQSHIKRSLSFPESAPHKPSPWGAPPPAPPPPLAPSAAKNSAKPRLVSTSSNSGRLLLPASLPEKADAFLSQSLLEQCRLESSSTETSPRSSLNNHHACGSWKSRVDGPQQKKTVPCSSRGPNRGYPRGKFYKQDGLPCRSASGAHFSALSAALTRSSSSSEGEFDDDHVEENAKRRRAASHLAQRNYRTSHTIPDR